MKGKEVHKAQPGAPATQKHLGKLPNGAIMEAIALGAASSTSLMGSKARVTTAPQKCSAPLEGEMGLDGWVTIRG